MRTLFGFLSVSVLSLVSTASHAASIPYSNVGQAAAITPITAASNGDVIAYFAGSNTAGNDFVRLFDVTSNTAGAWTLGSGSSTVGQAFNLGHVNQGDVLVFQLINYALMNPMTGTYPLLASDPAYSDDALNHTYVTGASASGNIPAGTFIAFEDYLGGYDFDYNDDTFVVTNLTTTAASAPEPGSFALLGTGLLAGASALRRRLA